MDPVLVYVRGPRGGRIVSVAPGGIVEHKADETAEVWWTEPTPSAPERAFQAPPAPKTEVAPPVRYREIGRIESVDIDDDSFRVLVHDAAGMPDVGETVWVREP